MPLYMPVFSDAPEINQNLVNNKNGITANGALDRKIFSEQAFAYIFQSQILASDLPTLLGIYRICQITAESFLNLANPPHHGQYEPKLQFLKIRQ
jgi:hypothetical protein